MDPDKIAAVPPIPWPVLSFFGMEFTVNYNLGVQYRLSKAGVDLSGLADKAHAMACSMDLWAEIAAPQLRKMGKEVWSGEQWAERLNISQHLEISTAVAKAFQLSKVMPAEESPIPASPAQGEAKPN